MKRERNISFSRFLSQRFHFRPAIAILLSLSLFITSCTPFSIGPSARDRAQNVIKRLEAIPDELERETASVITLNAFCTLGRLASGSAEGRVEMALADYFADHPPEVRTEIQKMAKTLDKISASERTELLGRFAAYDPGPCASAPDWDGIGRSVIFSHRLMPRLRANFCSGNLVYSDATPADRAITVGSQVVFEAVEPDGGPSLFELASNASPVILGVEGEFVSARHPALAVTATTDGDGMSPYGAVTDIPCSLADDSGCDPNKGLVCSAKFGGTSGHCVAYPVVQKDHELILRGYNFWDIDQARLIFSPLFPGEGTESTTIVDVVDANEPTSGAEACPLPTPDNPTHNRAHFRVTANEGHFYKLRMYNHNGNFFTQFDALEDADPRVIHVCFPDSEDLTNLPEGTIRDCTLPAETCAQDGAKCAATWGTPPRKLEECRHLPGEPPACGETPEWFTSEPLTERADDVIFPTKDIIVYVENEEPQYEFKATLQSVEAKEETGWDWTGSDEPMLLLAGFPDEIPPGEDAEIIDKMDESSDAWKGGDYDTGTRKTEVQVLSSLDGLTSENEVLYLLILAEDDGFLAGFLAGAAVIVVVAAIIYLTGGAGLIAAVGGAAAGIAIWESIMASLGEDDLLGRTTFMAKPLNFDERIASTHAADFLTVSPPLFGALPAPADASEDDPLSEGELPARLIHPFVDFSLGDEPLEAQCNPGICASGQVCLVNRCVDPGFTDPTEGIGFKERREFELNGGHYAIDILWEVTKTTP